MRQISVALVAIAFVTTAYGHPGGAIAVDAKGRVYFTDTYKGVRVIDAEGGSSLLGSEAAHWMALDEAGKWAGGPPPEFGRASPKGESPVVLTNPNSPCAIDADGTLYFIKDDELVRRPVGKEASVLVGGEDGKKSLRLVTGMAIGPKQAVYLLSVDSSDRTTGKGLHAVLRADSAGKVTTVAETFVPGSGDPPDGVRWGYCRGLAAADDGTVYVAGTGSRSVYRIGTDVRVESVLTADAPWSPTAVAVRGGEVWVLEYDHTPAKDREWEPRVRKVDKGGKVTTLAHVRREKR